MRWALAILLLSACATTARPKAPANAAPDVEVELRHLPDADAWQVHFRFSKPIASAVFRHDGEGFRQSNWRPEGPVQVLRLGAEDVLQAPGCHPFTEASFRVATYLHRPEKDYEPFIPYSDDGVLVFTGQFRLRLATTRSGECGPTSPPSLARGELPFDFRGIAREGERIIALGQEFHPDAQWTEDGEGTYAYFGKIEPIWSGRVVAVIDRAFPSWLQPSLDGLLPKLFDFYEAKLGEQLPFVPTVFLAYTEDPSAGRFSMGGGTLPRLVVFNFRLGAQYRAEGDPKARAEFLHLLAHESAHFWNSEAIHDDGESEDWLWEGSADYFARRALYALGLLDRAQLLEQTSTALTDCANALHNGPLGSGTNAGHTRSFYSCGETIQLIAEADVSKRNPGTTVFTVWRRLFEEIRPTRSYDASDFIHALKSVGADPETVETIRRISSPANRLPTETLIAELQRLGLSVRVERPTSEKAGFRLRLSGLP